MFCTIFASILLFFGSHVCDAKVGANSTISALTAYSSPKYNDVLPIVDTANLTTKKLTWAVATSSIKTDLDSVYSPLAGSASLVTVGTLTTGTWSASTINVNKGGTGSTTLARFQVLLGSSTNPIGVVSGTGSTGQFLTSNGPSLPPTWQSASVDQNAAYTWTGGHIWQASSTFAATSSVKANSTTSNAFIANGVKYAFPSSNGASSSVLTNDAQGDLLWLPRSGKALATSSTGVPNTTVTGTTAETDVLNLTLPANVLGTNNAVRLRAFGRIDVNNTQTHTLKFYYGGTSVSCPVTAGATNIAGTKGWIEFDIIAAGATNSQWIPCSFHLKADGPENGGGSPLTTSGVISSTPTQTAAIDSTIAQPIRMTTTDTSVSDSFTLYYYTVEVIN